MWKSYGRGGQATDGNIISVVPTLYEGPDFHQVYISSKQMN